MIAARRAPQRSERRWRASTDRATRRPVRHVARSRAPSAAAARRYRNTTSGVFDGCLPRHTPHAIGRQGDRRASADIRLASPGLSVNTRARGRNSSCRRTRPRRCLARSPPVRSVEPVSFSKSRRVRTRRRDRIGAPGTETLQPPPHRSVKTRIVESSRGRGANVSSRLPRRDLNPLPSRPC